MLVSRSLVSVCVRFSRCVCVPVSVVCTRVRLRIVCELELRRTKLTCSCALLHRPRPPPPPPLTPSRRLVSRLQVSVAGPLHLWDSLATPGNG